jgi:hypothetical protein
MNIDPKTEGIQQIESSLAEMSRLLKNAATKQLRQPTPGEWSFRDVAVHMATVEQECHLERVRRIATEEQPHFAYYLNTGRDFSHLTLEVALQQWATTRQELIEFVHALSDEQLALTGTHDTFGTVTVLDILHEMVKHDVAHIEELRGMEV